MSSLFIRKGRKGSVNGIAAYVQLRTILESFPEAKINKLNWGQYEVILSLRPKMISPSYDIKISFSNKIAKVFVINQTLEVSENRKKLPHVYSHEEQQLCLCSISKKEWTPSKLIVKTLIPWAVEWLYYYEFWLIDGNWLGGGHDEYSWENKNIII